MNLRVSDLTDDGVLAVNLIDLMRILAKNTKCERWCVTQFDGSLNKSADDSNRRKFGYLIEESEPQEFSQAELLRLASDIYQVYSGEFRLCDNKSSSGYKVKISFFDSTYVDINTDSMDISRSICEAFNDVVVVG